MESKARSKELAARPAGLSARGLLAVKGDSPGTTEAYRGAMRAFIAWARENGRDLSAVGLAEYVAGLREDGAGASTVNMALSAGKAALMQAAARSGMTAHVLAVL